MADAYEKEHMPGIGAVLHRQKETVPRWAVALVIGLPLAMSLFFASTLIAAGSWLAAGATVAGAALASAVGGAAMITFASARLLVSEGGLEVQLGFSGPRARIGEVSRVFVGPSGTNKNGIGIRYGLGGTTWVFMWGDNRNAVHVERTDGTRLVLVTRQTEALHQALVEALARRDGRTPRVRVEAVENADAALQGLPHDRDVSASEPTRGEGRQQHR